MIGVKKNVWWCLVGAITIVQCIFGALFLGCNIFLVYCQQHREGLLPQRRIYFIRVFNGDKKWWDMCVTQNIWHRVVLQLNVFQRGMGVMEERRSLADGDEEEEEQEDVSPQKLRTMIKEGIEVAILIPSYLNLPLPSSWYHILLDFDSRRTQRKVLFFLPLPTVAGAGVSVGLLSCATWWSSSSSVAGEALNRADTSLHSRAKL